MRTIKPVVVLGVLATALVLWLMTRMWFGELPLVWKISGILGAWSPVLAAVLYMYVRHIAEREHHILVAWLTRALGMHVVLLWMIGINDWLAGPPGMAPRWDRDAGGPVALVLFFPVFFLTFGALEWLRRVNFKLTHRYLQPVLPQESDRTVPNRGSSFVTSTLTHSPALWAPSLVVMGACVGAAMFPSSQGWIVGSVAAGACVHTLLRPAQLLPYVVALGCSVLFTTVSTIHAQTVSPMIALAIAPWVLVAAIVALVSVNDTAARLRQYHSFAMPTTR